MRAKILGLFMLSALLLSALLPAGVAHAATTWTVTKPADTNDGVCNSDCSLREAISVAQNGDSVVFAPAVTGTITLVGLNGLYISTSISITGPGSSVLAVSGNDLVEVFCIAPGASVQISKLTITHGRSSNDGAGIYNNGVLSLDQVVVSYNQAVPQTAGSASSGGGLFNGPAASLTITNSSITNNTANAMGAGLYNGDGASLSMTNVSVDHNQLTGANTFGQADGGGLFFAPPSGTPGTITLNRVSITNNTAPGGPATGGGLRVGASASISNSLIADNSAASGAGIYTTDYGPAGAVISLALANVTITANNP